MKEERIDVKSQSQEDFVALWTVLLSAGYHYHGLKTIKEINGKYPYGKYSINSFYIGESLDKEVCGNRYHNAFRQSFTLPEDFSKVINIIHNNEITEPIFIENVGNYQAIVYKDHIQVGCQTISFEKFDELVKAVNKVRDDS